MAERSHGPLPRPIDRMRERERLIRTRLSTVSAILSLQRYPQAKFRIACFEKMAKTWHFCAKN